MDSAEPTYRWIDGSLGGRSLADVRIEGRPFSLVSRPLPPMHGRDRTEIAVMADATDVLHGMPRDRFFRFSREMCHLSVRNPIHSGPLDGSAAVNVLFMVSPMWDDGYARDSVGLTVTLFRGDRPDMMRLSVRYGVTEGLVASMLPHIARELSARMGGLSRWREVTKCTME